MISVLLPVSTGSLCNGGYFIVLCPRLSVCDNYFLGQIMNFNFCDMLTSSEEEKPCKRKGRKWKRLLYCLAVSLFLPALTQELSCRCCDLFLQL